MGAQVFVEPRQEEPRGRYEVLRVVNRGGMGEIALARVVGTKGFEKLVMLKRLRADAEREDHIQMFDVEQEVMSRIEHPNIVKVFDQPIIDGIPYLAMEYIRGRNLDQIIRAASQMGEALQVQFALSVVSEVLRGLAFVHRLKDSDGVALGVVHQDMTPSNVLVSFFGEVKITDFGISYVTSRDGGLRKGVLKGKPRYVAPEVLAGKRVNNTADIYGVGVVLYELLMGRALFARPTVKETLSAVARNDIPDLHDELRQHGEGIASILHKSLLKDPVDRYRTAEAMGADVLNELSKRGGPLPAATLGYQVRHFFPTDPDVPEIDPALEQAITLGGGDHSLQPQDLDETLMELDRLMGPDESVDLFSVPPELQGELSDLVDMDPFAAETPLPDFVWEASSEMEILKKADEAFGNNPLIREPSDLFGGEEPPPRLPPERPVKEAAPPPAEAETKPKDRDAIEFPSIPTSTPDNKPLERAKSDSRSTLLPATRPPTEEAKAKPEPVAPPSNGVSVESPPESSAEAPTEQVPVVREPSPVPREAPARRASSVIAPAPRSNTGFWLGLMLGLAAGAAIGAAIFSSLGG